MCGCARAPPEPKPTSPSCSGVPQRAHSEPTTGTAAGARGRLRLPVPFAQTEAARFTPPRAPWPAARAQILTYLTGYQLYKHASNAAGTLALKRLLVEQQGGAPAEEGGEPERVRINYAPDLRLDEVRSGVGGYYGGCRGSSAWGVPGAWGTRW